MPIKGTALCLSILLTAVPIHTIRTVCKHLLHSIRRVSVKAVHPEILALFQLSLIEFLLLETALTYPRSQWKGKDGLTWMILTLFGIVFLLSESLFALYADMHINGSLSLLCRV